MSDAESQGQPQDRVGHLLKRMTLANLGLDDLDGVDEGSRATLADADRFAAQIDQNAQRLESEIGLSVLAGTPDFMYGVQERYVPLHVDTEFGLDMDIHGPRNPGDVGPWQKLIDGVHLILFDEDEEGDFVSFDPSVRKQQVRRAVAQMAQQRKAPANMPALAPVRRQLRAQHQEPQQEAAPVTSQRIRGDFLTISESARRSLFGPQAGSLFGQRKTAAEAQTASLFGPGEEQILAAPEHLDSLPGLGTLSRASFGAAVAQRHGVTDQVPSRASVGRGVGAMLTSLHGGVQLADEGTLGRALVARRGLDPRVVGDQPSSLSEAMGGPREGYHYLGAAPGSLLALVPEALESAAVAGLHGRTAVPSDTVRAVDAGASEDAAFVSAYPAAMGRAGMVDVRAYQEPAASGLSAALRGASRETISARARRRAAQQAAASTTPARPQPAALRQRLAGYSSLTGRSGQLLQTLADEPVARLAAVARAQLSAGDVRDHALLGHEPLAPSSLGFTTRDLMAPLGIEGVASASGRLTNVQELFLSTPATELVRAVDEGPGEALEQALVRRTLAERRPMTVSERRSLTTEMTARAQRLGRAETASAADGRPTRAIYGDVAIDRRFLPSLAEGLDAARHSSTMELLASRTEDQATASEEGTLGRLDRMLNLVGVGDADTTELRGALDVLKRVGAVPRESRLAWQGETPVLITPEGQVYDARTALSTATSAPRMQQVAGAVAPQTVSPQPIEARGAQSQRIDRFSDVSRMLGSRKALSMLSSDVLATADPIALDMLQESIVGEVGRLATAASDQAQPIESEVVSPLLQRVGLGRKEELRLATGIDSAADVVRMSVSGQPQAQRRSTLALRRGMGASHQLTRGRDANVRRPIGDGAAGLLARLDVESGDRPELGATAFQPGVLGMAQFEDRVDAEVESFVEGFTGLLGDVGETRPIRLTSETGEPLRLSLSPRAVSKLVSGRGGVAESRRAPSVPVQQLRTTLREVLTRRGATPHSVAQELQQRISGLSLDMDAGDEMVTVSRVAQTTRAIERAAQRFEAAQASVERQPGFFESLVPGGFSSAAPSSSLAMAFDGAPTTLVAQRAFSQQVSKLATERAEQVAGDLGLSIQSRETGDDSLAMEVASRTGGRGRTLDLSIEASLPGYEMVKPSSLSRVLKRFAPEETRGEMTAVSRMREMVDASLAESLQDVSPTPRMAAPSERFANLRGEPGQLSDTLEHFVPASSSRRPASTADTGPLIGSPGRRLPTTVSRAPGSLAHRIEMLESETTDGLLADVRREVLDRMEARSEPVAYVEPTGMSEDAVREMFDLGSGDTARRRGSRHEVARMLDRLDGLLDDAQTLSERQARVGAPGVLAQLKGIDTGVSTQDGLPTWRKRKEHIQGIDADELKDLLRQVGATPVQGMKPAIDRQLVNPYAGQGQGEGADPLFSGGAAAAEAKPSNQVQDQEAAFSAADVGLPPYEELMFIADEAYRVIMNKLREELEKRSE